MKQRPLNRTRVRRHTSQRLLTTLSLVALLSACASEPTGEDSKTDAATAADTSVAVDSGPTDDVAVNPLNDVGSATDATANPTDTAPTDSTAAPKDVPEPFDAGTPPDPPKQTKVTLPFGETLFFAGDDYLWSWSTTTKTVTIKTQPAGSKAAIKGDAPGRLTPDVAGVWTVCRATDECLEVNVVAGYLTTDTFLNYNYSPSNPIVFEPLLNGEKDPQTRHVWVTATTSNAVVRVAITGKSAVAEAPVAVGSWPTALVWSPKEQRMLITHNGRDSLGFLNVKTGLLDDAIYVGNEPANVLVVTSKKAEDPDFAFVALSGEDRVAKINLKTRTIVATVEVGRDPRAMAYDAATKRLYVAALLSSNAHPRGLLSKKDDKLPENTQRDIAVIDTDKWTVTHYINDVGTILRGLHLRPDTPGTLLAAVTDANNDKANIDADAKPHSHQLVAIDLAKAQTEATAALTVVELDKQKTSKGPAPSPYTMQLSANGHYFVATLSAGKALLLLDPKTYAEMGRIPTGHDPRGIVQFGGRIWTYAWLSNELQGHLEPAAPTNGKMPLTLDKPVVAVIGDDPTPPDVKAGQQMFNDAAFSKHGDFSCNNCHVDGITDGLVWDLLVDGSVNTLAFRNVGGTGPFLWGGQLPTLFDFSREVLKLVGATASGKQMEQLTTYMQSVTAPPNPYTAPGGRMTEAAKNGAKIFYGASGSGGASCGDCHSGPLYTNTDTVDGKTKGKKTDVPSLLGVYDTGPWGREAQWSTLKAMTDYAVEFTNATLNDKEKSDLLEFVRQLPGDRLYLTSAQPLSGSNYVWAETKVELTFSAVLADGQEGLLLFREKPDTGAPKAVPGTWTISGRYARFKADAKLKQETKYELRVATGLVGQLGEQLGGAITIHFATGSTPELDVSGTWKATLKQSLIGTQTAQIAFLQATGGQVTGALLTKFEQGDVDKGSVEGHVSGKVLVLDPFYLDTTFGKFFIEKGITSTCTDSNSDKFADQCVGSFPFKFSGTSYDVGVTFDRQSLPKP